MSKLNKYANLYDKDGNLLRHVNEQGLLEDYTMEELEALVDQLANDKDENGNIKNPRALNNANLILMQYYQKYGNPHIAEILEKLKNQKSTDEQVTEALKEIETEIESKDNNEVLEEQTTTPEASIELPEVGSMADPIMEENEENNDLSGYDRHDDSSVDFYAGLDEEYVNYEAV